MRPARKPVAAIAALLALTLLFPCNVVAAAQHIYGGNQTNASHFYGVDGNLRQSGTVYTVNRHLVNIGINTDRGWLQTGTYQGDAQWGSSRSAVHMYYENVNDACPNQTHDPKYDYLAADIGVGPATNAYYIFLMTGSGEETGVFCQDGSAALAYWWEFRQGSVNGVPVYLGYLAEASGYAQASTETHGAPINTDFFGCSASLDCNNTSPSLHLLYNGSWTPWTAGVTARQDNPPYVHTYNQYWSFKTCPAAC